MAILETDVFGFLLCLACRFCMGRPRPAPVFQSKSSIRHGNRKHLSVESATLEGLQVEKEAVMMNPAGNIDAGRIGYQAAPPAVSWGAIFAGAAAACAMSLVLLILGMGLGLAVVSPFSGRGASGTTVGVSAILWITFTQLAASAIGGYLAGRLRTKWRDTQTDEIFFRDTAHGFLAWAIATIVTAATLTSTVGAILGTGAEAAGSAVSGVASTAATAVSAGAASAGAAKASAPNKQGQTADESGNYFVDSLFRSDPGARGKSNGNGSQDASGADHGPSNGEVTRIFANALSTGSLSDDDARYIAQLVAARTGLDQAAAEKRVHDMFGRYQERARQFENTAREQADKARKGSAYSALWMVVSLLVGAFVASFAATYGGRQRDLITT